MGGVDCFSRMHWMDPEKSVVSNLESCSNFLAQSNAGGFVESAEADRTLVSANLMHLISVFSLR